MKLSKRNATPGTCTTCGTHCEYDRNTAGQCNGCHNRQYHEAKAARRAWLEEQRQKGREYWKERGIEPGDEVETTVPAMIGTTVLTVRGTAKVGKVGAYVSSPVQSGYLSPGIWRKAEQ